MGFPIDSKVLGLRDIIKERYRIPIYQRPYEWAEKNINDFLNTIFEAFSMKSEVNAGKYEKSVFFGQYSLTKKLKMPIYLILLMVNKDLQHFYFCWMYFKKR